jgi:PKD repeat protein
MSYYIAEIRFNKKSEKKANKKKWLIAGLVILTLISLLILVPTTLFSAAANGSEPDFPSILNALGFTNIALTDIETFSPGIYNITLYAEFTCNSAQNELSYYTVETSDFQTIFTGPEGVNRTLGGYVVPPIFKYFKSDTQFGISLLTPDHRSFTECERNLHYPKQHAQIYTNLDIPGMYLVGFESFGGAYRDYNDMVFSLVRICPPEIVSVIRFPETPNYDQPVTITAQVTGGSVDVESVILGYQIGSGSWINVTMSLNDEVYVADIPAQSYDSPVNYKVYASNTIGTSDVSAVYSYTVGDFIPPVISNLLQVPSSPNPNQGVKVSATVTEPPEASGIKNVTLYYTTNTIWSSVDMALQDGLWTATIPSKSPGASIKYFIEAFDNAENSAKTSVFYYTVIVPNSPPVADFSASPSTVYTGEVIAFNASSSYDPDGSIVAYSWDFGDGSSASGVTASHSYVNNGEYLVTLTVTDNDGAKGTKSGSVSVKNRPPVAEFTTSATVLNKQETVTFDASPSYDPDGTIVSYSWNFGDEITAMGVNVTHSYLDSGSYTVTLIVTDDDGATDSISVTKTVRNRSPVANFTESSESVYVGDTITFSAAESYDPDGYIVSYVWDFGDGITATGLTVFHIYADNGSYVVTLTVTDNDGAKDSAEATNTVMNRQPVALFTETSEIVNTDETISFDASESYDRDGAIVGYSWDFGDGTTATGISVQHAFSQNGTYTVTLVVTDDDGATDSTSATETVLNQVPIASFSESAETVSSGEIIHFDASGSYDPDGSIVSYVWGFGDGITATGTEVDHSYIDSGIYIVTLTVTDDDGATGLATATKNILNRPPVALFTENATTVTQDEAISFDASESYDRDGAIVGYSWDFGDGTTATGVTVDHVYSEDGNYTVTLTVTDDDGASSSVVAEMTVETGTVVTLAVISVIGLGVAALTATLLYGLFVRRRKKKRTGDS